MSDIDVVTVSAPELRAALRIVKPFREDESLTVRTEDVHLWTAGTSLYVLATNRYHSARVELAAEDGFASGRVLGLDPAHVKALCRLLAGSQGTATVDRVKRGVRVAVEDGTALRLPHSGSEMFVDWGGSIPAACARIEGRVGGPEPTERIDIDPQWLAPYARVSRLLGETRATWTFHGATSPVRVTIGDRFTGLVMPIRPLTDGEVS